MSVDTSLESNAQLAEGSEPGISAFDNPSMAPEPIVALDTPAGNAIDDASVLQMSAATREVVALVRMQLVRPAPWPADPTGHRRQGIGQLLEDHRIVPVGTSDTERQRDTLAVCDDVALAAELSSVSGVGARVRAPRGLGTLAASRLARLKLSRPQLRNSVNSSRCNWCHTPAACHWRNRRQQVMPLPKPSSWGRSSQAMPVRSTNKMPLSVVSSLIRGRPPLAEATNTGSSGSIFLNSAALISLFFFPPMHCQTPRERLAMTWLC